MPEKPREEFLVSLAGPAVNIVIAGIWGLYLSYIQPISVEETELGYITRENFAAMLLAANVFIVAFNLIPAFPMDGGRLFRSALSVWMSRIEATRIAKNIGQIFAIIFIIAGFYINPFLVIIGFFILLGARGEYEIMKYQNILKDHTVQEITLTDYEVLAPDDKLINFYIAESNSPVVIKKLITRSAISNKGRLPGMKSSKLIGDLLIV